MEAIVEYTDSGVFKIFGRMTGELIRCKDCRHQRKEWHEDKRRANGGTYTYWCDYMDEAPIGYDTEFCSHAERRVEELLGTPYNLSEEET